MEPDGGFWAGLAGNDAQGKLADVDGDGKEELVLRAGLVQVGSHTEWRSEWIQLCPGVGNWARVS